VEENVAVISAFQHPRKATVTINTKAVGSTETTQHFITTRCKNPKDHNHLTMKRRKNLKTCN
jgi:hypothetical protein